MLCANTEKVKGSERETKEGSERGVKKSITDNLIIDYPRTTLSTTLPTYNSSIPKLLEYFFCSPKADFHSFCCIRGRNRRIAVNQEMKLFVVYTILYTELSVDRICIISWQLLSLMFLQCIP